MRLTLTQFITLDGVCQGPGGPEEDTSDGFDRGGWLIPFIDPRFVDRTAAWLRTADALLLGRRTYDSFARDWPQIDDPDDPFSERMNTLPKFVVSSTLRHASWGHSTIISAASGSGPRDALDSNVLHQVVELKARPGGDLQLHGSARLAQSLLAAELVDEIRLAVAPVVLGAGRRLFGSTEPPAAFRLTAHEITSKGLMMLDLAWAGRAGSGRWDSDHHAVAERGMGVFIDRDELAEAMPLLAPFDGPAARDGNLVTSRSPDDLPAFCSAIVEQFGQVDKHADSGSSS